jgi:hypothetical protein
VTFDMLPGDALDEIRLQDCPVGQTVTAVFALRNHSTKVFRFKWPTNMPQLVLSPATGHLLPGCSKDMTLTFTSPQPCRLAPQDVRMSLAQVRGVGGKGCGSRMRKCRESNSVEGAPVSGRDLDNRGHR